MQRKLVQQGNATLMVSLPASWVKENRLQKGSTVDVVLSANQLQIVAGAISVKESTTIVLTDEIESSIRTLLTVAYRQGYDILTISYKNKTQRNIILSVKKNLLGFDITRDGDGKIVLENIMEPSPDQFATIFDKVIYNMKILVEQVRDGEPFNETENRILSYDNFCRRCISKNHVESKKRMFYWNFLSIFVHASREVIHHASIAQKNSELFVGLLSIVDAIHTAYAKKDIGALTKIHALEKQLLYGRGYKLLKKDALESYHLLVAIRQCYLCSSSLTGILSE